MSLKLDAERSVPLSKRQLISALIFQFILPQQEFPQRRQACERKGRGRIWVQLIAR
jgi:hypothetical protein